MEGQQLDAMLIVEEEKKLAMKLIASECKYELGHLMVASEDCGLF